MPYIQRAFHSLQAWRTGRCPFATPPRAPHPAPGGTAPGADVFAAVPWRAHVALAHRRKTWIPIDIGEVEPAREDERALGASFPPPDLDEAAGFIGRVRFLGPMLGRALMLGGGFWAGYAAWVAAVGIQDDVVAAGKLRGRANEVTTALPPAAATERVRAAVVGVLRHEAWERLLSCAANVVLLPGSALMACNLLGSAELVGHFVPVLVPVANAAMGPAVFCMTVYGALVAGKALWDIGRTWRAARAVQLQAACAPGAQALLAQRAGQSIAWDAALAAAGLAQALGAVLQFYLGPIYLLVLLPGTFALGLCKLGRAKQLGHALFSPLPDVAAMEAPTAILTERLEALHAERLSLQRRRCRRTPLGPWVRASLAQALTARGADCAALIARLGSADDGPHIVAQGADLVQALGILNLFAPFALAVAGDVHLPRPASFEAGGRAYQVHARDVVALFDQAGGPGGPDNDAAAAMLARMYRHAADVIAGPGLFAALREEARVALVLAASWR